MSTVHAHFVVVDVPAQQQRCATCPPRGDNALRVVSEPAGLSTVAACQLSKSLPWFPPASSLGKTAHRSFPNVAQVKASDHSPHAPLRRPGRPQLSGRSSAAWTMGKAANLPPESEPLVLSGFFEFTNRPSRDRSWGVLYLVVLALAFAGGIYSAVHW